MHFSLIVNVFPNLKCNYKNKSKLNRNNTNNTKNDKSTQQYTNILLYILL